MKNLILLLLLLPLFVKAQDVFTPAEIVLNNQEILQGFVSENYTLFNVYITFKSSLDSVEKNFYPGEIISYKFSDDQQFFSKIIPATKENPYVEELFCRLLINGEKKLYSFNNSDNIVRYFIEDNMNGFRELVNKSNQIVDLSNQSKPYFKGILKNYFLSCPSIFTKVDKTDYNYKSLSNLFIEFYECSKSEYQIYDSNKEVKRHKIEIYGFTGMNVFLGVDDIFNYLLGGGVNVYIPKSRNIWSVYSGLNTFVFSEDIPTIVDSILLLPFIQVKVQNHYQIKKLRIISGVGMDILPLFDEFALKVIPVFSLGVDYQIKNLYPFILYNNQVLVDDGFRRGFIYINAGLKYAF